MPIEKGISYTWPELLKEINAERSEPIYALHRKGQFIGFALNRWQNPSAPDEILVGVGQQWERYADDFVRLKPILPVFIRENPEDRTWTCAGFFQMYGHTQEKTETSARAIPKVVPAVYRVLFMEETQPPV